MAVNDASYNVGTQVGGMLGMILVSMLGMASSLLLHRLGGGGEKVGATLLLLKSVGVGVVICTSLIHLINEASEYFENAGWADNYEAWPMVFAIVGIYGSATLDFVSGRRSVQKRLSRERAAAEAAKAAAAAADVETGVVDAGPLESPSEAAKPPGQAAKERGIGAQLASAEHHCHGGHDVDEPSQADSQHVVLMVEASIFVHSVLIGFDLGLQFGDTWTTLFVALCFHQFFEGLALAQVMIDAQEVTSKCQMRFAATCYVLATAVGNAIGIVAHVAAGTDSDEGSFDIPLGILNSLCGGVLLYLGLVSLLLPWITRSSVLLRQRKLHAVIAHVGLALGLALMAVLALWA